MEVSDFTSIVFNKIRKYDPENAFKVIGYLYLRCTTTQELVDYAFGTDAHILSLINEAKSFLPTIAFPILQQLQQQPAPDFTLPPAAALSRSFSSPSSTFRYWDHSPPPPPAFQDQHESSLNSFYPSSVCPEFRAELQAAKACQYYHKGFCKHGDKCWYLHGGHPSSNEFGGGGGGNEEVFDRLEAEIRELLKERVGQPLSIASLPTLYLARYGKVLQAEGYLTESQRHGKSGFSLTKLLARLNNGIRLIHGQNGQHLVILAEDAHKYIENKSDRYHQGGVNASSNQIYLTFPAESTFTDDDVENYFKQYGLVHDVRIPHQEKRMFGFVSFVYPETVRCILAKGNPHYICGSRVLVKPYKEKSKLIDRKNAEKTMFSSNSLSRFYEMDQNPNTTSRLCHYSEIFKKQSIEEREYEIESKHPFDLQLTPNKPTQELFFGGGMDDLNYIEDRFSNLSIVPKNPDGGGKNDDTTRQMSNNRSDKNSAEIDLPESPFASPL
ncbi:zinc finger CCCH domain-containing protein 18-like [Ananas comosus]|uniref:Zinc finger CCCH domain-containing protein 18-like n=1 Tax=Ananas comosus TaxID=4615 RepID=A0A199US74_ANACO|nr:zinc finger CCCH domain-containing protein 18-like [Ananas comosus]OAY67653.1 Zinc finger CCCH domain-containing protein 54 [Ananas comosus]